MPLAKCISCAGYSGAGRAGGVLLVSQFTLAADTSSGLRPSFTPAAPPEEGRRLFDYFVGSARRASHCRDGRVRRGNASVAGQRRAGHVLAASSSLRRSPRRRFVTAPVGSGGTFRNFTYLMTTQVLFIRHGETDWNRIKRIQGHIDIPLAASGMAQAGQLAQRLLQESKMPAPELDASVLQRSAACPANGETLCGCAWLDAEPERRFARAFIRRLSRHSGEEIRGSIPTEYAIWQSHNPDFSPPDGESQRAFSQRVLSAVEPIVAAHPDGRIAVVAHGGRWICIYRFVCGLPLDAPRDWPLLNSSINVVDFENGKRRSCPGAMSCIFRPPAATTTSRKSRARQIRLHGGAATGSFGHAVVQRPAYQWRDHPDARPGPRAT